MKKRTSTCSSLGEKLKVGIRTFKYGRTPFRSAPGCGFSRSDVAAPVATLVDGLTEALPAVGGVAFFCGAAAVGDVCSGACVDFSSDSDGSCRNRSNQLGSTRAPSLVNRGGNCSAEP